MDVSSIFLIEALLFVLLVTAWSYDSSKKRRLRVLDVKVPPGSLGLPFIGNTLEFTSALRNDQLKALWEKKRALYGPICKTSIMGDTVVLLDPPAGNKFIYANDNKLLRVSWPKSFSRIFGPNALLFKTSSDHYFARRHLIRQLLGPDAVAGYISKMEQTVLRHLEDHWKSVEGPGHGKQVSVQNLSRKFTFAVAAELCISLKCTSVVELEHVSDLIETWGGAMFGLPINVPGFAFHRGLKAGKEFTNLMIRLIQNRKEELSQGTASSDQDLMSLLLTQPDDNGHLCTDGEIIDYVQNILHAALDTSSSVLDFTISNIARYPEVYQNLISEHKEIVSEMEENQALTVHNLKKMKYTWMVVLETMRLTPNIVVNFRQATETFEYKGFTIHKGWKILSSLPQSQGMIENWEKFDPSRFQNGGIDPGLFSPFGGGPRACPGSEFAKMEILLFLHHLLRNFKWSLVDPNEKVIRNPMPQTPKGTPIYIYSSKNF
ncbi:hypothetical protein Mapa_000494 [Marchantia paleacea]|nr:hypothetical protein Mapa_000494 [Marchantia paleacea]